MHEYRNVRRPGTAIPSAPRREGDWKPSLASCSLILRGVSSGRHDTASGASATPRRLRSPRLRVSRGFRPLRERSSPVSALSFSGSGPSSAAVHVRESGGKLPSWPDRLPIPVLWERLVFIPGHQSGNPVTGRSEPR